MDQQDQQMFVRSSKYRHVYGSAAKKENCYEGVRVTKSAHDSNFCAVNRLFVSIVVDSAGGGAFIAVPIEKTGRVDVNIAKVCGHRSPITDIKWNPFNDNEIASSSEDCTVKLWHIPNEGLTENITEWSVELTGHSKKVSYIEWHPSASNILLSAGADLQCIVWNTLTETALTVVSVHRDTIFSLSWNRDGSAFATTCKDRSIRVIDPRSGRVISEGEGHQGTKASKIIFLGKNRLFTTGFSRHSERQFALWDTSNLSKPLKIEDIDSSSGSLIPFNDPDTGMVYLAGKGDGNIRYFEIVDSPPYVHYLSQYQSSSPQRGIGMIPKYGVDVAKCEIVRFYKLHTQKDFCEPISMIVPRKSEMFQADIYPPTAGSQPAMTVDQWISGVNKDPLLVSLKDGSSCPNFGISTSSVLNNNIKTSSQNVLVSTAGARGQQTSNSFGQINKLVDISSLSGDNANNVTRSVSQLKMTQVRSNTDSRQLQSSNHFQFNAVETQFNRVTIEPTDTIKSAANQITVKRMSSMTSDKTPHYRLSRNLSDVSDMSSTTPKTPGGKPRLSSRRVRQRQDDDSSSCSSTEAVDQSVDDTWRENPLYANQQHGRRRNQSPSKPRRRAANSRYQTVDTGPLDDLLTQTAVERDRFVSKSNAELHLTSANGSVAMTTRAPHSQLATTFRSEPDVAMTTLSIANDDVSMETMEQGRGTMIDCISIEAPDDTVIKPSRLRASMNSRQRRSPASATASVEDLSLTSSPSSATVRRVGSLRQVPPSSGGSGDSPLSGDGSFKRGLWKTASLRETRPREQTGVTSNVNQTVNKSNSQVSSASDVTSQNVVLHGSSLLKNSSSAGNVTSSLQNGANNQYSFTVPVDVARRRVVTSSQAAQDVLPSFNRNIGFTSAATTDKLKKGPLQFDQNGTVSYEQLLRDYQQLQEKYDRQRDEVKTLKEQSVQKDMKIRQLENQLRISRTIDNGGKLYHGHDDAVIGVKGHGNNVIGVKGVC